MKDKSKVVLVVVILILAALIAYVCYGITKGQKNPLVTMQVSYLDSEGNQKTGTVKMELYPSVAPETVKNFIALANNGFYDGLTFHRIAKDFVIQGGDKEGTGSGSSNLSDLDKSVKAGSSEDYSYGIKGEFAANGINNTLKFEKGVIGMARSDYSNYGLTREGYNSASSQFFVVTTNEKSALNSLNQNYAPFGKVIEGYEYIEEMANLYAKDESAGAEESESSEENKKDESTETEQKSDDENTKSDEENANSGDEDKENKEDNKTPKMTSIRVETYGANYGLPNAINTESTKSKIDQIQSNYQSLINSQAVNTVVTDTNVVEGE